MNWPVLAQTVGLRTASTLPLLAVVLAGCLLPERVAAGDLHVEGRPCAQAIHVRADQVPLEDVVKGVARALDLRLELKTSLPDLVTVDRQGSPEEVLKRLLSDRNLVLDSAPSARCKGRDVLRVVWLLPAGQAVERPPAPAPAAAPLQKPGEVEFREIRKPLPSRFRKRIGRKVSAEEWRQITRDYQAGKIVIDPVTGMLVAAEPPPQAPAR